MANKYLILGATYNGDGTTSSEAGSNGGAGAWNQQSILTGTAPAYGSLAAGDTVFIRSKTGNGANANITITVNGSNPALGNTAATAASPITWVLDGGSVWSSVSGTMTWDITANNSISTHNYNRFVAAVQDAWVIKLSNTGANNYQFFVAATGCEFTNFLIDYSATTTGYYNIGITQGYGCIWRNTHVKVGGSRNGGVFRNASGDNWFINPDIELLVAENATVFDAPYNGLTSVLGGCIRGVGATSGVSVTQLDNGAFRSIGLQYPGNMNFVQGNPSTASAARPARAMGTDGGLGATALEAWGMKSSRTDGYYPTLNGAMPGSGVAWSWWVYPAGAKTQTPARIEGMLHFGNAAAVQTITLEFLVASGFSGLNKSNCYLEVSYTDNATGLVNKFVTTLDPAASALDSSTASWSVTTIAGGALAGVSFNKRKAVVTTPTAIKQNTPVTWALCVTKASSSSSDVLFVDPSPQFS